MGIRTAAGKAKVMGTVLGIGGAMLLTFVKGPEINIWKAHINLLNHFKSHEKHLGSSNHDHVIGCLLAIAHCSSYAIWLIIQVINYYTLKSIY